MKDGNEVCLTSTHSSDLQGLNSDSNWRSEMLNCWTAKLLCAFQSFSKFSFNLNWPIARRLVYLLILLMSSPRRELWTLESYTTLSQITPILLLCDAQQCAFHPRLSILGCSFRLTHHNPACISPLPHACHIPRPSHPLRCDHPNAIWWGAQIINLLVMQSSPVSCYVTPSRPLCLYQQFCYVPYTGCYKNISSKNGNNSSKRCSYERRHILITK